MCDETNTRQIFKTEKMYDMRLLGLEKIYEIIWK